MKTIQWGIIGCGDVTEKKSGPALSKIAGSRLVAVMRRDGALAADYARRHHVPIWLDDADALIQHPEVNAVYVATPPGAHAELALKVATAGKPCYVEKPFGANARESHAMCAAFAEAGLPLLVAYYRRALPWFVFVKDMLEEGKLGTITELRYRFAAGHYLQDGKLGWRGNPAISGGGLFVDLGSHALNLFDYWLGELGNVKAWNRMAMDGSGVAQQVGMTFETESGVPGTATWNFACTQKEDLIELYGTDGIIRCSVFNHGPIWHITKDGQSQEHVFDVPDHIQQPLLEEVVLAIRNGIPCRSTGLTSLRTNEVMDIALPGRT
ncbi:MAG: Gfo/Idh/MocA family protein [Candidatus Methylacidiphilales bacterium]|nr:Gfo/Idh/MocA family oxidoreductase [Candidatus Methylacidiphilales bacterium]